MADDEQGLTRRDIILGSGLFVAGAAGLAGEAQAAAMTDVDNLDDLAAAISNKSPAIRRYAIAQAAATQSQETDIRQLLEDVDMLKRSVSPPPPGGVSPPPTGVTLSPIGFISSRSPGFFPPTNIEKYGFIASEGPPPQGFVGVNTNYRTGVTCQSGYTNISQTECLANGWAMHYNGNVLPNQAYGGILADPANTAYQQRWIQASITFAQNHGARGFFIDDTGPRVYDFYNGTYGNVWPDEHPSEAAYRSALVSFADAVKAACASAGFAAPAFNTAVSADNDGSLTATWWQQMGPHVGYLTAEYWMAPATGSVRKIGGEWYNNWDGWRAIHGVCTTAGCGFMPVTYGSSVSGGDHGQSYVLGTYLLDWAPGTDGSLLWEDPDAGTTTDPWSSFYTAAYALGSPSAAATQISTNVWRRQFSNGTVTVNANTGVATIP